MRRFTLIAIAWSVVGCAAPTPLEIREGGTRVFHDSKLPPQEAAACLGRAAEEHNGDMRAVWRETAKPGNYELLLSMAHFTHVAADIVPRTSGSTATIYVQPRMMDSIRDRLLTAMLKGC